MSLRLAVGQSYPASPSTRWYLIQATLHVNGLSVCQMTPSPCYPACQWTARLPGDTFSMQSCMSINCPSTRWYLVQAILHVNGLSVCQVIPSPCYPACPRTVRLPGGTLSKLSCMSVDCPSTSWYLLHAILHVSELPVYQMVPCPSYPAYQHPVHLQGHIRQRSSTWRLESNIR